MTKRKKAVNKAAAVASDVLTDKLEGDAGLPPKPGRDRSNGRFPPQKLRCPWRKAKGIMEENSFGPHYDAFRASAVVDWEATTGSRSCIDWTGGEFKSFTAFFKRALERFSTARLSSPLFAFLCESTAPLA